MGVFATAANGCRHVVFAEAASSRAVNLGARRRVTSVIGHPIDAAESPGECDEQVFLDALFFRAGIRARHYRPAALRRRLPACLRALRATSAAHARDLVRRHAHLVHVAVDALLLGVTEFFRDAPTFQCLHRLVPSCAANRDAGVPLRVWSAGCSDGAELYSVAILLDELNLFDRGELLGTDCREAAVRHAEAGWFSESALRGVSDVRRAAYFDPSGRVVPRLRGRTTWRCADVLAAAEPGPWDLIFCRNLAMYLEPHAAERLWPTLASVLRPGGLLVVGKAERPSPAVHRAASLSAVGPCVYRRQGGAAP